MQLEIKNRWFYKRQFLWLLIFNLIFFIVAAYLLPSRFEENDDVFMLLFASGKYSGTPEAHLVFINYIYGLLLKLLYTWNNHIEWYSVLFAFFHVVSMSVISCVIVTEQKILRRYRILFLIVVYLIEIKFILLFQFTTTATLCALAGILLITRHKKYQQIAGILLFIIAGLIRFDAAFLVLLIISPVFLKFIFVNKKIVVSNSALFMLAAIFVVLITKYIDYQSYQQTNDWKYYRQYNQARGSINDNPYTGQLVKFPDSIPAYDYALLLNFFPDGQILNLGKLNSLKAMLKNVSLNDYILSFISSLRFYYFVFITLIICLLLSLFLTNNPSDRFRLGLSLVIFLATLFYINTFGRIKSRVFLSAVIVLLFVIFFSLTNLKKNKTNYLFGTILVFLSLILAKENYFTWSFAKKYRQNHFSQQQKILSEYLEDSSHIIIPFANNWAIQYYFPFAISDYFKSNQIFFSSWLTNIPLNEGKFESYLDIVNGKAIFLNKNTYNYTCNLLQKSIKYNYGIDVHPTIELETKDYAIVRLVTNKKVQLHTKDIK
jgi:hypothetical protein